MRDLFGSDPAPDAPSRVELQFWGVRGSAPTPRANILKYGGNTTCMEVRLPDDQVLIFDAGTGLRDLGHRLSQQFAGRKLSLNMFLTHFHWDHIQGLPFFAPLYSAGNEVTFHSFPPAEQTRSTLERQMSGPYFPVNFEMLSAEKNFRRLENSTARFGKASVESFQLNHPQRAFGYRIQSEAASIVFATDLEHGHPELDSVVRKYAEGADILIYDAQYTPEEYPARKGWGHSTWREAVRVARDSRVKELILFHHDPARDDAALDEIVREARTVFENTHAAREGHRIHL